MVQIWDLITLGCKYWELTNNLIIMFNLSQLYLFWLNTNLISYILRYVINSFFFMNYLYYKSCLYILKNLQFLFLFLFIGKMFINKILFLIFVFNILLDPFVQLRSELVKKEKTHCRRVFALSYNLLYFLIIMFC